MAKYTYPHCPECDTVEDWFGIRLPDPYAWLRDGKDPRVLDFVARENACTDAFFPAEDLRAMIAELKARAVKPLPTGITPWKDGYIGTMRENGDYRLYRLDAGFRATEELPRAEELNGLPLFRAEACPADPDILAMMIQYPGAARPCLAVCRVSTREVLRVFPSLFSFCWCSGDGCVYYSSTQSDPVTQQSHSVFVQRTNISVMARRMSSVAASASSSQMSMAREVEAAKVGSA